MSRLHSAVTFAFLDRYAGFALGLAASMIIARILTPADIGVWAVAGGFIAYLSTFRDLGAGQYLVQAGSLDPERIRAAWSMQLGMGLLIALAVISASGPLASFYGEPVLRDMLLIVAGGFALNPFGSITYAVLMRELRFDRIAMIRFASAAAAASTSIYLAWRELGPISLAWGSLAGTAATALLGMILRPAGMPWMPGWRGIGGALTFGSSVTLNSITHTLITCLPELLLGRLQGMTVTGLYSRANGLVTMYGRLFADALGPVAMAWFAEQRRAGRALAEPFIKATACLCAPAWSLGIAVTLLAHPLLVVLFGAQWGGSAGLARLLAAGAMFSAAAAMTAPLMLACGASAILRRASLASGAVAVILFAVGAPLGAPAMCIAVALCAAIGAIYWIHVTRELAGVTWLDFLGGLAPSLCVAACAGIGPALAVLIFGIEPAAPVRALLVGTAGGVAGFVLAARLVSHPLYLEWQQLRARTRGAPE